MIGAVDLHVTIRAGAIEDFIVQVVDLVLVIQRSRVSSFGMASLAEERNLGVEQLGMVGAVGVMAVQAILLNRNMIPKERHSEPKNAHIASFVLSRPVLVTACCACR